MASNICRNLLISAARRSACYPSARCFTTKITMGDPLEHATGLQQRELLARAAGNDDPFGVKVSKRGPGTKDQPNLIPSANDCRIVGCVCEEEATTITWMWLHKGEPRRCECGHWFKLVYKEPFQ